MTYQPYDWCDPRCPNPCICEEEIRRNWAPGPDDFDGRRDQLHQQEREAAWEADPAGEVTEPDQGRCTAHVGIPSAGKPEAADESAESAAAANSSPGSVTSRDDWAIVDEGLAALRMVARDFSADGADEAACKALARLRARDQARTDALIEAAWSYRQKADEPHIMGHTAAAVARMAADTLTRIAETT